jgi:hypothetical protein
MDNSLERLKSCSTLNDQDEMGIGIHFNQSLSDLNPRFGSFDSFLNSLALGDNSQFSFIESSPPSSSGSSPEAGLTITAMEHHSICLPKQSRHTHRAGSENCQYCGATFLRPSDLKYVFNPKHLLSNFKLNFSFPAFPLPKFLQTYKNQH